MSTYASTPTRTLRALNGIDYAYRRQGAPAARPLIMLQHFRQPRQLGSATDRRALGTPRGDRLRQRGRRRDQRHHPGIGPGDGPRRTRVHRRTGTRRRRSARVLPRRLHRPGGFADQAGPAAPPRAGRHGTPGCWGMHGWVRDIIDAVGSPNTTGPDLLHAFFADTATSQQAGKATSRCWSAFRPSTRPSSSPTGTTTG